MQLLRISLLIFFSISLVFPHNRYKKKKKYRNKQHHKMYHHIPRLKVNVGYNYPYWRSNSWAGWRWNNRWIEREVIVLKESDDTKENKNEEFDEIISQIEKLAELKEEGLITDKEFEKKRKKLLKQI